jgi:hypothetical protein
MSFVALESIFEVRGFFFVRRSLVAGCGGRRTVAVSRRGSNRSYRVVSNICEGKLILCVDLIRFFCNFLK